MARKPRYAPGGIAYHVMNRTWGKIKLFEDDADYEKLKGVTTGKLKGVTTKTQGGHYWFSDVKLKAGITGVLTGSAAGFRWRGLRRRCAKSIPAEATFYNAGPAEKQSGGNGVIFVKLCSETMNETGVRHTHSVAI